MSHHYLNSLPILHKLTTILFKSLNSNKKNVKILFLNTIMNIIHYLRLWGLNLYFVHCNNKETRSGPLTLPTTKKNKTKTLTLSRAEEDVSYKIYSIIYDK